MTILMPLLVVTAGCQPADSKDPELLYLHLTANPTTLDPALIVDVSGAEIAAKLFNGLVQYDRELSIQPDIAERWIIADDGNQYTFFLRPGVLFHNGREVTAHDFKYSFERVLNPATQSPRTWVLDRISGAQEYMNGASQDVAGIQVRDPYTLVIRLNEPFSPFLSLLSLTNAYVVPREEVNRWGPDFSFHVMGTGPYRLEDWQHGSSVRLAANAHYFKGTPRLTGVVYRIIPEPLTTMVEFEIGNLDVIRIPASEYGRYVIHPEWRNYIVPQPSLNTYYLGFNCQKTPFSDRRLRQAVAYAVDREKIRTTLFESRGVLAEGPIPPLLRKLMPPLENPYPYNPQKSVELMNEAGYPLGFSFQITVTYQPETLDIVEVIQHYLKKVNVETSIVQLEWSSFKDTVASGKTDAFWLSWWADYPDVENFLYPLFYSSNHGAGGNRTFFENPHVDRLIEQAQHTVDDTVRFHSSAGAERIIIEEAPMMFFWHKTDYFLYQPWVRDFVPYPLATSDKGMEIGLCEFP
jgi:peptide/nickel transport system substrate-binding protein/oligopeptide transport system substrate-binding protein